MPFGIARRHARWGAVLMGATDDLRRQMYAHFENDMEGSVPDSVRMLERYSPEALEGFYRLRRATTTGSSLSKKVRELIIIAVEAALKKDPIGHARIAVQAGATPQEIHDAVALTLWLAGMPAYHHGMKAVRAAEELVDRRDGGTGGNPIEGPVRLVSAAPPGGGWHELCERTASALRAEDLVTGTVDVVVTPGGLRVFEDMASTSQADGSTLVAFSPGLTMQILMKGSKYTYADIVPLAALCTDYGVLAVRADAPFAGLREFLDVLGRHPLDHTVIGGSSPRAMHHGMLAVLAAAARIPVGTIRYVGAAGVVPAVKALLEGQASAAALGSADLVEEVRSGAVRVLAVLAESRLPGVLQDVPTAAEQGYDVRFPMWRGFYGPRRMPPEAAAQWTMTLTRLAATAAWRRTLQEVSWHPFLVAGQDFREFLEADTAQYRHALSALPPA